MTSSLHGVDGLGYKCATMGITKRSKNDKFTPIKKNSLSSNCSLQLECMKEEWIVIAVSFPAVNMFRVLYTLPVTLWKAQVIKDTKWLLIS